MLHMMKTNCQPNYRNDCYVRKLALCLHVYVTSSAIQLLVTLCIDPWAMLPLVRADTVISFTDHWCINIEEHSNTWKENDSGLKMIL